jgi:2-haloalkanoic acid dehalogenase type II
MLYSELLARAHEVFEQRLRTAAGLPAEHRVGHPTAFTSRSASTSDAEFTRTAPADLHAIFAESIKDWLPFPDTVDALHTLARHFKLVVLSNVDRAAFAHTNFKLARGAPLPAPFSLVLTAQDTLAYKPSPAPLSAALAAIESMSALGNVPKEKVLVVAQSLYHDHAPARALGVRSVWIDRTPSFMGELAEESGPAEGSLWTWRFNTLGEMAEAVERELGGSV